MAPARTSARPFSTRGRKKRGLDRDSDRIVVPVVVQPSPPPALPKISFGHYMSINKIGYKNRELEVVRESNNKTLNKQYSESIILGRSLVTIQKKVAQPHKNSRVLERKRDVYLNSTVMEEFNRSFKMASRLTISDEVLNRGLVEQNFNVPSLLDIKRITDKFGVKKDSIVAEEPSDDKDKFKIDSEEDKAEIVSDEVEPAIVSEGDKPEVEPMEHEPVIVSEEDIHEIVMEEDKTEIVPGEVETKISNEDVRNEIPAEEDKMEIVSEQDRNEIDITSTSELSASTITKDSESLELIEPVPATLVNGKISKELDRPLRPKSPRIKTLVTRRNSQLKSDPKISSKPEAVVEKSATERRSSMSEPIVVDSPEIVSESEPMVVAVDSPENVSVSEPVVVDSTEAVAASDEEPETPSSTTVTVNSETGSESDPETAIIVSSTTSSPEKPINTVETQIENNNAESIPEPSPVEVETLCSEAEPDVTLVAVQEHPTTSSDYQSRRKSKPGSRLVSLASQCPQPRTNSSLVMEETEESTESLPLSPNITLIALDGSSAGQVVKTFSTATKRKITTEPENLVSSPEGKFPKIVSVTGGVQIPANSTTTTSNSTRTDGWGNPTASDLVRRSMPSTTTTPTTIVGHTLNSSTDPRPKPQGTSTGFRPRNIKTEMMEESGNFPRIDQVVGNSFNNNTVRIVNGNQIRQGQIGRTALNLDPATARLFGSVTGHKQYTIVPMSQLAQHGMRIQGGKIIASGKLVTSPSGRLSLVRPATFNSPIPSMTSPVKTYSVNPLRAKTPQAIPVKRVSLSGANLIVCPPPSGSGSPSNADSVRKQIEDAETEARTLRLKEMGVLAERAKYPEIRIIKGHQFMVCKVCTKLFKKGAEKSYRLHMYETHLIHVGDRYPIGDDADSDEDELEDTVSTWYKCKKCGVMMQNASTESHIRECHDKGNGEVRYECIRVDLLKIKKNSSSPRLICGLCEDKSFDTSSSLRQHLVTNHVEVASKVLLLPVLRCGACLLKFSNTGELTRHAEECRSRPHDDTILELADHLRYCEVCTETHKDIVTTAKCYKEMGIERCMICGFGKSIRGNFASHVAKYHSSAAEGITCSFCVIDQNKQFASVNSLFQHIMNSHYTTAFERRDKKRSVEEFVVNNNSRPQSSPSNPVKVVTDTSIMDDLRYQAVLQSKRPLRPKLSDIITISPVKPLTPGLRVYPPIAPAPLNRNSTIVTPAITISPILSSGPTPVVSSTTASPPTFPSNPTIIQVDLNSILAQNNN